MPSRKFLREKKDIEAWLDRMGVYSYTLLLDEAHGFVVNVAGDLDLSYKDLDSIAVKFNTVEQHFFCHDNKLTSLCGAPGIVGGAYLCNKNQLTSLEGVPKLIDGTFDCSHNQLTSLEGCPQTVCFNFSCSHNQLTSLLHTPQKVMSQFDCSSNNLLNLEHCPQWVASFFNCQNNPHLGCVQDIRDFKKIYQIHRDMVNIQAEHSALSQAFMSNSTSAYDSKRQKI